jgi:diguanylate cyclase (GGDEF)-like protein/PAS domain S-box-containing protein
LTLRQALAQLEEEGLVSREQGRGTFVRAQTPVMEDHKLERQIIDRHLETTRQLEAARRELDLFARSLRESEDRFRATFERAAVGIAHTDIDGSWLQVNQRLLDLYGYTREELKGLRFHDITHPDDLADDLAQMDRLLAGEISSYSLEKRYIRKDGSILWGNITLSLVRGAAGEPKYLIAVLEDIGDRKRTEEALRESEARYRTVIDGAPFGISLSDSNGYLIVANQTYQKLLGYSEDELRKLRFTDITHPSDIQPDLDLFTEAMAGKRSGYEIAKRYIRKDGRVIWVRLTVAIVRDTDGNPCYDVAMVEDISERKQAEADLREAYQFNEEVISSAQEGIVVYDRDLRYVLWNPFIEQLTGLSREEVIGSHALDLFPHLREQGIDRLLHRALAGETVRSADISVHLPHSNTRLWVTGCYTPHRNADGEIVGVIGVINDLTERKRAEEALEHQALHDTLTDLPNRTLLYDRLEHAILAAQRHDDPLALLLMDLDRFKEVNDTFGHHYGDLLLQQLGPRLESALRESDTVARLGGDEFAALLPATDQLGATSVAEKLLAAIEQPFVLDGQSFEVRASIGVALYPTHGDDATTLLQRADVAMYLTKRAGSGYTVYAPEEDQYTPKRLTLVSDLRRGIEQDQVHLHYQPKVDFRTGAASCVEALARWRHPEHDFIPPADFIPQAEHTGLIKPLTRRVLNEALHQCRVWYDARLQVGVAVNLSTRNLHDQHLVDMIARLIRTWAISPTWLTLEIGESAVMTDPVRGLEVLTHLHAMGVKISIDDFGTGYSSLAYLTRLPIDELKIDKSFVLNMRAGNEDASIVRSIIDLGHSLGMQVAAEGVENRETWGLLAELGCDLAQGYYVSRPLPADECARWLRER